MLISSFASCVGCSGLPGSRKSTLGYRLADQLNAMSLRLDAIKVALLKAGLPAVSAQDNAVAYALSLGQPVMADTGFIRFPNIQNTTGCSSISAPQLFES